MLTASRQPPAASRAASVAEAFAKPRLKRSEPMVEPAIKSNSPAIILPGYARVMSAAARARELCLAVAQLDDEVVSCVTKESEPRGCVDAQGDGSRVVAERLNTLEQ